MPKRKKKEFAKIDSERKREKGARRYSVLFEIGRRRQKDRALFDFFFLLFFFFLSFFLFFLFFETVPGVDQAECVVVTPGWSDRVRLCRSRAGGRAIIESQLYLRARNPVGTLGTNTDRLVSVSLRDDSEM